MSRPPRAPSLPSLAACRSIERWVVGAVLASAVFGCGDDKERIPDEDESVLQYPSTPAGAEARHGLEARDPAPAMVRRVEGPVTIEGAAAPADAPVEAEQMIDVPPNGRAVLQLRDGGRVEVDGNSRVQVVDEGAAQLLLVRGSLYAAQPPAGNAPRPPLRVVSPTAAVEVGQAGEFYLVAFENGGSWVAVLGGLASVSSGEADARRRLRTLDLGRGQAVAVPARVADPTEGPERLAAARTTAAALAASSEAVGLEQRRTALAHEVERLDQALRWLETETRRGRQLTTEHRAAVRAGQSGDAQRLQAELVDHSQALYRLRRLATARWERLRAQQLRLADLGASSAADPVSARRDRVVGLLGL